MSVSGWIGVDLDGTLAKYVGGGKIGDPIPAMLNRVKNWLSQDIEVRIFTARAAYRDLAFEREIREWCIKHIGRELPVTASKDFSMIELWDDRAIQVIANTGMRADGKP